MRNSESPNWISAADARFYVNKNRDKKDRLKVMADAGDTDIRTTADYLVREKGETVEVWQARLTEAFDRSKRSRTGWETRARRCKDTNLPAEVIQGITPRQTLIITPESKNPFLNGRELAPLIAGGSLEVEIDHFDENGILIFSSATTAVLDKKDNNLDKVTNIEGRDNSKLLNILGRGAERFRWGFYKAYRGFNGCGIIQRLEHHLHLTQLKN